MVVIRTLKPSFEIALPKRAKPDRAKAFQGKVVMRRRADYPPPTPQPTPCVLWQGAIDDKGYGTIHRFTDGKRDKIRPHRWVMEQLHGPLRPDQVVMHLCDNPRCYRVSHLRIGTHAENVADMIAKGRYVPRKRRGDDSRWARQGLKELKQIERENPVILVNGLPQLRRAPRNPKASSEPTPTVKPEEGRDDSRRTTVPIGDDATQGAHGDGGADTGAAPAGLGAGGADLGTGGVPHRALGEPAGIAGDSVRDHGTQDLREPADDPGVPRLRRFPSLRASRWG
jgi:hypothetical protein